MQPVSRRRDKEMEHYAIIKLDEDTFITVDWAWLKKVKEYLAEAKPIMDEMKSEGSFLIPPEYREEFWDAAQEMEIKPKKHPLQGGRR